MGLGHAKFARSYTEDLIGVRDTSTVEYAIGRTRSCKGPVKTKLPT